MISKMDKTTAYNIFGLVEGCGEHAIKEKFRKLIKTSHPDTLNSTKIKSQYSAEEILEARNICMDIESEKKDNVNRNIRYTLSKQSIFKILKV